MNSSRHLAATVLILLLATSIGLAQQPLIQRVTGQPDAVVAPDRTLIVHEWGTFTTMQGSDGRVLSGLYLEEESLPGFVYHHEGFAPDPNVIAKGLYKPVMQATVKMETPVLYFYSNDWIDNVSVRVDFPPGTISQWYPQRSAGEVNNISDYIDLTRPYNGWIEWQTEVLPPGARIGTSAPKDQETHTWTAPRATDANLIRTQGREVEGFLFYRGVANFTVPLHAAFNAAGELVVTNTGDEMIPYIFVTDPGDGVTTTMVVFWTGPLNPGASRVIPSEGVIDDRQLNAKLKEFENALTSAGLYQKEAAAMLDTWSQSYFGTPGLRIFWIVPRGFTDRILPIDITPAPAELERVLVGRSEIMTPQLEKELLKDFTSGNREKWGDDRYILAYDERLEQMKNQVASAPANLRPNEMLHASFTSDGSMEISGRFQISGEATIGVSNILGQQMFARSEHAGNGIVRALFDAHEVPSGIYFLTVQIGDRQWVRKVVKE